MWGKFFLPYISVTLRNKNSFSKPSNQRDLREEPSAKHIYIYIYKSETLRNKNSFSKHIYICKSETLRNNDSFHNNPKEFKRGTFC